MNRRKEWGEGLDRTQKPILFAVGAGGKIERRRRVFQIIAVRIDVERQSP